MYPEAKKVEQPTLEEADAAAAKLTTGLDSKPAAVLSSTVLKDCNVNELDLKPDAIVPGTVHKDRDEKKKQTGLKSFFLPK